jgi:hypothetical protein
MKRTKKIFCLFFVIAIVFPLQSYSQLGTLKKLKNRITHGEEKKNIVQEELPESLLNANYKFDDPELTHEKIEELLYKSWDNCDTIYTIRVQKFAPGQEYLYYKTDYGLPWYKDTWPATFAVYKGKDSTCYFVEDIQFQRVYDAGEYGKPFITFQRDHMKIRCDKALEVKETE